MYVSLVQLYHHMARTYIVNVYFGPRPKAEYIYIYIYTLCANFYFHAAVGAQVINSFSIVFLIKFTLFVTSMR